MRRRSGFSLVEVIIVIAILGMLLALLLPAVQKVRESAARSDVQNRVRQIGLALHQYAASSDGALPGAKVRPSSLWGNPSPLFAILPYLEPPFPPPYYKMSVLEGSSMQKVGILPVPILLFPD